MSFLNPQFIDSVVDSRSVDKYTIIPYELNLNRITSYMLVFDFPPNIKCCINETPISSICFDYLNPLLITPTMINKIKFFRGISCKPEKIIPCKQLILPQYFQHICNIISASIIYYPPYYTINYQSLQVSRNNNARQICDFLPMGETPLHLPQIPLPDFNYGSALETNSLDNNLVGNNSLGNNSLGNIIHQMLNRVLQDSEEMLFNDNSSNNIMQGILPNTEVNYLFISDLNRDEDEDTNEEEDANEDNESMEEDANEDNESMEEESIEDAN